MSPVAMLPSISDSTLLVIDVQQRLLPAMAEEDRDNLVKQVTNLIEVFKEFGGEVAYTEQYPKGLGATVEALKGPLDGAPRIEKVEFSALRCGAFAAIDLRREVVVCGIEAHVCVLQTTRDLLAAGHRVWVPYDAVSSRRRRTADNALDLMRSAGARVINAESVVFDALERAGTDTFRKFSKMVR